MGMRRPKVLVVDGDDELVIRIHRALYFQNNWFDILCARNGEVGRQIMREVPINVLVAEANLPGMSGLDLAYWAAVESADTRVIVLTGGDISAVRERAGALGCLRLVGKPVDVVELQTAVVEAIERRDHLSGKLSALSAADLLQMLCLGRKTAFVRISAGDISGGLMVASGELIHAVWGNKSGEQAAYEIMAVEDGVFSMAPLPAGIVPTISSPWQHVLMEAARILDERARTWPDEGPSRPFLRVDDTLLGTSSLDAAWDAADPRPYAAPLPEEVEQEVRAGRIDAAVAAARLVDRGFAALRTGHIEDARACWKAAQRLEPDNRSIELNLRKLEARLGA